MRPPTPKPNTTSLHRCAATNSRHTTRQHLNPAAVRQRQANVTQEKTLLATRAPASRQNRATALSRDAPRGPSTPAVGQADPRPRSSIGGAHAAGTLNTRTQFLERRNSGAVGRATTARQGQLATTEGREMPDRGHIKGSQALRGGCERPNDPPTWVGVRSQEHDLLLDKIPGVPDLQSASLLLLLCGATRSNYLLGVLTPDETLQLASEHDTAVMRRLADLLADDQPLQLDCNRRTCRWRWAGLVSSWQPLGGGGHTGRLGLTLFLRCTGAAHRLSRMLAIGMTASLYSPLALQHFFSSGGISPATAKLRPAAVGRNRPWRAGRPPRCRPRVW